MWLFLAKVRRETIQLEYEAMHTSIQTRPPHRVEWRRHVLCSMPAINPGDGEGTLTASITKTMYAPPARLAELTKLKSRLDPFELARIIDGKLKRIPTGQPQAQPG
jgi:hypothetical protein